MIGLRHENGDHLIEQATGLRLTYADTGLHGIGRFAVAGVRYRRPVRATMTGTGSTVPIRDHVMITRLAVVALLIVVQIWGRRHDR